MDLNTPTPRQEEEMPIITFPVLDPLPQTTFIASKVLPNPPQADSLLVKRKQLRMSKYILTLEKPSAFFFEKPTFQSLNTNPLEFKRINKSKEVLKKTKPLNKNSKILTFLSDNNSNNNNNNSFINAQDIYNLDNINTLTPTLKVSLEVLVIDSQIKVPNSTLSSHFSLIINSTPTLSSPLITSFIIDSNASTQAMTVSSIYSRQKDELYSTLSLIPLILTLPLLLILIEENSDTLVKVISISLQKN
jgi:hypothetical protein